MMHEHMLDSLRATVLLLNQDIEHLVRELMIQSSLSKPLQQTGEEGATHRETTLRTVMKPLWRHNK